MSFSRPIQWYHSQADPIWPDGTFNATSSEKQSNVANILTDTFIWDLSKITVCTVTKMPNMYFRNSTCETSLPNNEFYNFMSQSE
jgi:hypothetical protein